jgi:hypothetical protein
MPVIEIGIARGIETERSVTSPATCDETTGDLARRGKIVGGVNRRLAASAVTIVATPAVQLPDLGFSRTDFIAQRNVRLGHERQLPDGMQVDKIILYERLVVVSLKHQDPTDLLM